MRGRITISIICLSLATLSYSNPTIKKLFFSHTNSSAFLTCHWHVTGKPKSTVTLNTYAGVSLDAPCSDLQLLKSETIPSIQFESHDETTDSEGIINDYGPGYSCIKSEIVAHDLGKTYTTGSIILTWDIKNQRYTQARPNVVEIEVP